MVIPNGEPKTFASPAKCHVPHTPKLETKDTFIKQITLCGTTTFPRLDARIFAALRFNRKIIITIWVFARTDLEIKPESSALEAIYLAKFIVGKTNNALLLQLFLFSWL